MSMIESIWQHAIAASGYTYVLPAVICMAGYVLDTQREVERDVVRRAKARQDGNSSAYYSPSVTVGHVLGRLFKTLCPVVNVFPAIAYTFELTAHVTGWLGRTFDRPLVKP